MICYVMGWYDGGVRHCHGVVVVVQAVSSQWLGFTRSHHQARAEQGNKTPTSESFSVC